MEILEVGEKLEGKHYDFRKLCFGIVEKDGQFMMVYTHKDRNHSMPGGGVEEDETPEEAIKREFLEEAGYEVESAEELVQVHCYWNLKDGQITRERFAHIFVVKLKEETKQTPLEDWHIRVYVDKEDAAELTPFPYQKAGYEYYLKNFKR